VSLKGYGDGRSNPRRAEEGARIKPCRCGAHNASNAKSNTHHHSTARRLAIRQEMVRCARGEAEMVMAMAKEEGVA